MNNMKSVVFLGISLLLVKAEIDWNQLKERKIYTYLKLEPSLIAPEHHEAKVVGGFEAKPHQFPYQVGLVMNFSNGNQAFCGGSLISQDFVLTAAHCVDGVKTITTILGAHKIRENETTQVRMISDKFIIHEGWNPDALRNDIALIRLPERVKLNENIKILKLPAKSEKQEFTGDMATISGWGKDFDVSNTISPVLRYVEVEIENNFRCGMSYPLFIHTSHICTNGRDGKSSCNGDSGGPLTVQENGSTIQIGVVSFGRAAGCEKGHPAVFTRITSFLEWIEKNSDVKLDL